MKILSNNVLRGLNRNALINVIKELQEENRRLSKEIDMWNTKYNEMFDENRYLKERIDKATKIIKDVINIWETRPNEIATLDLKELLEILKGAEEIDQRI